MSSPDSSPTASGTIPISQALAEAEVDSIAELLNRNPEQYKPEDRARIVQAMREQRARWERAEAEAPAKPKRTSSSKATSLLSATNPEDLGL